MHSRLRQHQPRQRAALAGEGAWRAPSLTGWGRSLWGSECVAAVVLAPLRHLLSLQTEGVRVSVNVLSKQKGAPLLFVVRQKEAVVSFQVPLILRGL